MCPKNAFTLMKVLLGPSKICFFSLYLKTKTTEKL